MPVPFILGGLAVAAAGYGVKKVLMLKTKLIEQKIYRYKLKI